MSDRPIRIAITADEIRPDEAVRIQTILDYGWDSVQLRMPSATLKDMRNLIEKIPQKYHGRLWLHGHFELVNEFNLGGLQLNKRCPLAPTNYRGKLAKSCHSVEEVLDAATEKRYERVTLSPIFDSVSKKGYNGRFSEYELEGLDEADSLKIIALGGITPEKTAIISRLPFSGYAVLGYLYEAKDINELKQRLQKFDIN